MNLASCFSRVALAFRPSAFAVAFFAFAAPAAADPILIGITGGSIDITLSPEDVFDAGIDLSGPDFALRGSGSGTTGAPCDPCPAGHTVSTDALIFPRFGSFTLQGVTFEFDLFTSGGGELSLLSAGQFTLPQSATDVVTFNSLFVLDPRSFIRSEDLAPGVPGVMLNLMGRGEVTLSMRPEPRSPGGIDTVYFFDSMRFEFGETPTPIPEPTTLVLLGSGLTGVAIQRWRRRTESTCASDAESDPMQQCLKSWVWSQGFKDRIAIESSELGLSSFEGTLQAFDRVSRVTQAGMELRQGDRIRSWIFRARGQVDELGQDRSGVLDPSRARVGVAKACETRRMAFRQLYRSSKIGPRLIELTSERERESTEVVGVTRMWI
jgi:hypothetical protein